MHLDCGAEYHPDILVRYCSSFLLVCLANPGQKRHSDLLPNVLLVFGQEGHKIFNAAKLASCSSLHFGVLDTEGEAIARQALCQPAD